MSIPESWLVILSVWGAAWVLSGLLARFGDAGFVPRRNRRRG